MFYFMSLPYLDYCYIIKMERLLLQTLHSIFIF